jgi:hypothetical protein
VDATAAGLKGAGGLVYTTSSTNYYVFFLLSVKPADVPTGGGDSEKWCLAAVSGDGVNDCAMATTVTG